jgi:hypothetical protein
MIFSISEGSHYVWIYTLLPSPSGSASGESGKAGRKNGETEN